MPMKKFPKLKKVLIELDARFGADGVKVTIDPGYSLERMGFYHSINGKNLVVTTPTSSNVMKVTKYEQHDKFGNPIYVDPDMSKKKIKIYNEWIDSVIDTNFQESVDRIAPELKKEFDIVGRFKVAIGRLKEMRDDTLSINIPSIETQSNLYFMKNGKFVNVAKDKEMTTDEKLHYLLDSSLFKTKPAYVRVKNVDHRRVRMSLGVLENYELSLELTNANNAIFEKCPFTELELVYNLDELNADKLKIKEFDVDEPIREYVYQKSSMILNPDVKVKTYLPDIVISNCEYTGRPILISGDREFDRIHFVDFEALRSTPAKAPNRLLQVIYSEKEDKYYHYTAFRILALKSLNLNPVNKEKLPSVLKNDKFMTTDEESALVNISESYLKYGKSTTAMMTRIQSYSYAPSPMPMISSPDEEGSSGDNLYFGVEMEFDDGGTSHDNANAVMALFTNNKPYLYSTTDSSINNGFEMKTVPITYNALTDKSNIDLMKGLEGLKSLGYTGENDTCGLHIHVSKDFIHTSIMNYMIENGYSGLSREMLYLPHYLMSNSMSNNWFDVVKFTRRERTNINRWAKDRADGASCLILDDIQALKSPSSSNEVFVDRFKRRLNDNLSSHAGDKYTALAAGKNATYEFRIFRGTTDYNVLMASIQYVKNLVHMSIDYSKDIIKLLNVINTSDSKDNLDELKDLIDKATNMKLQDVADYEKHDELNKYLEGGF